jgi:hypothetical protein
MNNRWPARQPFGGLGVLQNAEFLAMGGPKLEHAALIVGNLHGERGPLRIGVDHRSTGKPVSALREAHDGRPSISAVACVQ